MQPQRDRSMGGPAGQNGTHPHLTYAIGSLHYPLYLTVQGGVHGAAVNLTPSWRSVPNPDLQGGVCQSTGAWAWTCGTGTMPPYSPGGGGDESRLLPVSYYPRTILMVGCHPGENTLLYY